MCPANLHLQRRQRLLRPGKHERTPRIHLRLHGVGLAQVFASAHVISLPGGSPLNRDFFFFFQQRVVNVYAQVRIDIRNRAVSQQFRIGAKSPVVCLRIAEHTHLFASSVRKADNFRSRQPLAIRAQHPHLRLHIRQREHALHQVGKTRRRIALQSQIRVVGNFQVQEDGLARSKLVHDHQRHVSAMRQGFAGNFDDRWIGRLQGSQLLALQLQRAFVPRARHSFSQAARRTMRDAEHIIQLAAAITRAMSIHIGVSIGRKISGNFRASNIAPVAVKIGRTTVCHQRSPRLHERAYLLHLLYADRDRLRHDEDFVFSGAQISGGNTVFAHKVILQRHILHQLGPTVAHSHAHAVAVAAAFQHPFPRIFQVVQQPMRLDRCLRVVDGDAIVLARGVDHQLANACMQFVERIRKCFGRRRQLAGPLIHKLITRFVVIPNQRRIVAMEEAPPDGPNLPLLIDPFLLCHHVPRHRSKTMCRNHDDRRIQGANHFHVIADVVRLDDVHGAYHLLVVVPAIRERALAAFSAAQRVRVFRLADVRRPLHAVGKGLVHKIAEVAPRTYIPVTGRRDFSQLFEVAVQKRRHLTPVLKRRRLVGRIPRTQTAPACVRLIERPHLLLQRGIIQNWDRKRLSRHRQNRFPTFSWRGAIPPRHWKAGAIGLIELRDGFISSHNAGKRDCLKRPVRRCVVDHGSGLHPCRPRVQFGVIPMRRLSNAPLPSHMRRQPIHVAQVVRKFLGAEFRVAKIVGANLVALPQLIRNVVKQRPIRAVNAGKTRNVFAQIFRRLRIVDARITNPQLQILPVHAHLGQQGPPFRLVLVVNGEDLPRHLFHIEFEIVVQNGVEVIIDVRNDRIHPGRAQLVVKSIGIVSPADGMKIVPRRVLRRHHEFRRSHLRHSIHCHPNPIHIRQTSPHIE